MKNNTIRYLMMGFGVSLILLLVSTVASFISISRLVESSALVNQANTISLNLESIISNIKDAETGFRGYVITRDAEFLKPYQGAYDRVTRNFETVESLTLDNPVQQKNLESLHELISRRFAIIEQGLNNFNVAQGAKNERRTLEEGKAVMDSIRLIIDRMENEENRLLKRENETLGIYTSATPVLVVGAALLSLLITIVAFMRIRGDLKKREALQQQVEEAAASMKQRVAIIANVAEKISAGNYTIRIDDKDKGELGGLAEALNQMAADLQENFLQLEKQAWLQQGVVQLNDQLKGEKDPQTLSSHILNEIVHYLKGARGILYLADDNAGYLESTAGFAVPVDRRNRLITGEGLVGQVARDKSPLILPEVPVGMFRIASGLIDGASATLLIYPLLYNNALMGVLEVGLPGTLPEMAAQYLDIATANAAIALHTAGNRLKLEELLQETQAQSEELQVQQDELHRSNAELEMQTQKLQASEEELRVQQEELMQSNQDMEEKAQLLEEKNQFIEQKSRELIAVYRDIEIKNKELEKASRYKSEFLANMSHELRTPLNSILLLAKLLAESKELELGEDRYEYARVIHSSGQGLLELINEILDLSKIEAGQMQITIEEVPFADIRQDMAQLFSPLAAAKHLELNLEFDAQLPATILSDKQRLEQILKNLLSNAIKFTEAGSVTLRVAPVPDGQVRFTGGMVPQEPLVAFTVTDTGIGIPKEDLGMVFEAFKQVDGSSRRKYGGTGLGLSISREISRLLGGEIRLASEMGKGSTFTVYLPLAYQEPEAGAQPAESSEDGREEQSEHVPEQSPIRNENAEAPAPVLTMEVTDDRHELMPGDKAILIVEDDVTFIKALVPFVKNNGYKVLVATRGDAGVAMARQYRPAGILLDVNLPALTGWDVIERLKHDLATRHIPVHMMSSEEARRKSLSAGAIDFINKPLVEQDLNNILNRIETIGHKSSRLLLIIEENKKHAAALSDYFNRNRIDTVVAQSGQEGMALLKTENFDGVILDITITEAEAYTVLDQIKRDKSYEKLPVVVYTGNTVTAEDEKRISAYAATSIVKKANTYLKLLNEVSVFLHLVDEAPAAKPKHKLLDRGLNGKTVLLADDDARNVYSLTQVLEMQGVTVIPAANGVQALELLAANPQTDAVLIDIMMPEMDGYETITAIRKQSQYKILPVIAVTAKTMPTDRSKCIEAGASDYISKPVDIDQLLSLLKVWLY